LLRGIFRVSSSRTGCVALLVCERKGTMPEVQPQEIRLYRNTSGKSPFREWIRGLADIKAVDIINARLTRLRLGNFGDCKSVGDGVLELRVDFGPGYRIYFGRQGSQVVILLVGGDKSTQNSDIATAKGYWDDYQQRLA
jgi:putative addiction module killer protein